MSIKSIIDAALRDARKQGGAEKVATSNTADQLVKEAAQCADALEYMAGAVVDDGTVEGAAKRGMVSQFFKRAESDQPSESVAPTGTQAVPPQTGATKILPTGKPGGAHPPESVAPTGVQATIGQAPDGKTAHAPKTLLELLTNKAASDPSKAPANAPTQSVALQDAADPGKRGENTNVDRALGTNEAPVSLTKRDAKLPTRERLKALFASAADTNVSAAAAKAAFPTAAARGGLKVAMLADPDHGLPAAHAGRGAAEGAVAGALGGGLTGAGIGGVAGAVHGAADGLLRPAANTRQRLGRAAMQAVLEGSEAALRGGTGAAALGGVAGAVSGGVTGHHEGTKARRAGEKKASAEDLTEFASLFDKAAAGELGEEAAAFAAYVEGIKI